MESIIRHGQNVDEAVKNALDELGICRDEVEVEVIDEGSRGFLGIGHRESRVRVTVDRDKKRFAEEFLSELIKHIDVDVEVTSSESDQFIYCQINGDDLGLVIGRHGKTLNALQYLVNVVTGRSSSDRRTVIVDAGDYRSKRRETVKSLAERMAMRAVSSDRSARLDPMPPHERKIVHTTLQDDSRVTTHSEGEDPRRYVIITPQST